MNLKEFNELSSKVGFFPEVDNEQEDLYEIDYKSKSSFSKITVTFDLDYDEKLNNNTSIKYIKFSNIFEDYIKARMNDNLEIVLSKYATNISNSFSLDCVENCLYMLNNPTQFLQEYYENVNKLLIFVNNNFSDKFNKFKFYLDGVDNLFTSNNNHKFTLYYRDDYLYRSNTVIIFYNPFSKKSFIAYGIEGKISEIIELKDLNINSFIEYLSNCYNKSKKQDYAPVPITSEEFINIIKNNSFYTIDEFEYFIYGRDISYEFPHKIYNLKEFYTASIGNLRYLCTDNIIVEIEEVVLSIYNITKEEFGKTFYKYKILDS